MVECRSLVNLLANCDKACLSMVTVWKCSSVLAMGVIWAFFWIASRELGNQYLWYKSEDVVEQTAFFLLCLGYAVMLVVSEF